MFSLLLMSFLAITAPTEVRVEIMRSQAELSRGLQGHRVLREGEGMLFVFPEPEVARFWMKSVTFPIDIIFIDPRGRVVNIADSVPPCPRTPCAIYSSDGLVSHVLEVAAGWSRANQWKTGTPLRINLADKKVTFDGTQDKK